VWVVHTIVALGPRVLPRVQDVSVDGRVLGVAALLAICTGVLFGLVPALHAARPDIASMLRASVRGTSRGGMHRTRTVLVVSETALAVVLLIGAGLLIRSFDALQRVDLGFRTENVVTFDLALPGAKYRDDASRVAAVNAIADRLRALPGTQTVGVTVGRPLGRMMMMTMFDVAGRPVNDPAHRTITEVHAASPSFFGAMGMSLKAGRLFTEAENRMDGHHVLLINQELARRFFPNENPIGKELILGMSYGSPPASPASADTAVHGEVVGIVNDVKQRGLATDAFPSVYVPYNTLPAGNNSFVVRASAAPAAIEREVRGQVRAVDPNLPVFGLQTMSDVVSDSVSQPRFYMYLLGAFAALALLLAALGIYGVISYTVTQRSREIGIRIALGATRNRVVRDVVGQGITMTAIGVGTGLVAAFALTRLIAALLFGVAPLDPATFAVVGGLLLVVAVTASWLPARRAGAVDPLVAMRTE
jgi:putative ABC transport system permease protein